MVRQAGTPLLLLAGLLGLAGCGTSASVERFYSSRLPFDTPIEWWHQLEGGVIADERPPPPGVGQPYPAIGTVPARPAPTDAVTRGALLARLATERTEMTRDAAQTPIVPPGAAKPVAAAPPSPSSPLPAVPDAPPPMARIEAATAPAPLPAARVPAAPPAPAAIQQAASPTPSRPGARTGPSGDALPTGPAAPVVSGPVPALPAGPPALPVLPGIPATVAAAGPAMPAPAARPQAMVAFLEDSAVLLPASDAALRALAARRSGGPVAVLGGGDARSAAPEAQAAALPLAWRRARAIQAVLASAGVPASAMRVDAAALGRGGVARLVN